MLVTGLYPLNLVQRPSEALSWVKHSVLHLQNHPNYLFIFILVPKPLIFCLCVKTILTSLTMKHRCSKHWHTLTADLQLTRQWEMLTYALNKLLRALVIAKQPINMFFIYFHTTKLHRASPAMFYRSKAGLCSVLLAWASRHAHLWGAKRRPSWGQR